jgi:hypothetical protein
MDVELVKGIFIFAFVNLLFSLYARLKFFQVIHKRYPEINIKEEMDTVQDIKSSDIDKLKILTQAKWAVIYNRVSIALFVIVILVMNVDVLTM